MTVTVLLFSSYAEALGASSVDLDLPEGATVGELLERVRAMANGKALPPALVALNQEYAELDNPIEAGAEVAIIPPVAGG
jgi:molybdopterin converting factor subunit 1